MPGWADLEVRGEQLWLLASRAVYWPRKQTLLVADVHWGHDAALRRAGIPIPLGTTTDDLTRLSTSIDQTGAQRLVVLGDMLHARGSRQAVLMDQIDRWRSTRSSIRMTLVRGNHDRHAGDPPSSWNMEVVDEPLVEAPFVFCHEPQLSSAGYVLAGHIHPVARLRGRGAQQLRVPCFHFTESLGVLPAFSSMARGAQVYPAAADRVFLVADGEVIASHEDSSQSR
jgi:DNA ligase-associated metallophosphoesterase